MTFISFPYEPRVLKATEARLEKIRDAARLGLKGDKLAVEAGMTPLEYRQLRQFDPAVEQAELEARSETERNLSRTIHQAALNGDAKIALEILKHQHDWVAKQQINVDVDQKISIVQALAMAEQRVQSIEVEDVQYTEIPPKQLAKEKQKAA